MKGRISMDAKEFEQEVRRLARLRWPQALAGGAEMIDGQERDGVFITEDCVHLVECTISRAKTKAQNDLEKLFKLSKRYRTSNSERAVKCWFITLHEPTADQRACRRECKGAPENLFNIISLAQFQAAFVDAHSYLSSRSKHKFGSVYDPRTNSSIADVKYIEVGLRMEGDNKKISIDHLATRLIERKRFTILGDYGVGKSMTLREIFRSLQKRYVQGKTSFFPIYINLREHQGQREPAEVLERHARNIGFESPHQLVRAWKAGYTILLLDGFDEVASTGLQGSWRRLREARHSSMAGIRKLISDGPACGIAIAGREHFFDTTDERRRAIGQTIGWNDVRLDDFGESEIIDLMEIFGIKFSVPTWFPTRPLLLSSLFAAMVNAGVILNFDDLVEPAKGWDFLLEQITEREARIETGITGSNIRRILETLATIARQKVSGLGPITTSEIVSAFEAECGFSPTDEALIVIQRLPGLGRDSGIAEDSRNFIDHDFADACRAGDTIRFCIDPYNQQQVSLLEAQITLGGIGILLTCLSLRKYEFNSGKLIAAINAIQKQGGSGAVSADLFNIAKDMKLNTNTSLRIEGVTIERIHFDTSETNLSCFHFRECLIDCLEIFDEMKPESYPHFEDCLIAQVIGRVGYRDLPDGVFTNCTFESFLQSSSNTNSVLELAIPLGAKVTLTVLEKLFVQSVHGRKENALFRGLAPAARAIVPEVLDILTKHGYILKSNRAGETIWLPVRQKRGQVLSILSTPSTTSEKIMMEAREI